MTIAVEVIGQYILMVLFIILFMLCMVFQTEQHFSVVLLIMFDMVVLTFESVDEIPECDHLNQSYSLRAVLSCAVGNCAGISWL